MEIYKLIRYADADKLEQEVNKHLKDGWKCQGGICIAVFGHITWYAQAMIKEK